MTQDKDMNIYYLYNSKSIKFRNDLRSPFGIMAPLCAAAWLIELEGISSTNAHYQIITHYQTFDIVIQHDCFCRMPQYFQASTLEIVLQKITAKTLLLKLTTPLYQS